MGKKNQFFKVVSVSTAIAISSVTVATANQTPDINAQSDRPSLARESNPEQHQIKALPSAQLTRNILNYRTNSDAAFSQLIAPKVAQSNDAQDTTQNIIKPAQQSIPSTQELNPSGNSLSFPTQPNEVEVDDQKPITLEQAIELSLKNNKEIEEARLQVESSEAALRQEKAALYPTLDLTSSFNYTNSLFLDTVIEQSIEQDIEEGLSREQSEGRFTNASSSSFDFDGALAISYDIFTSGRRGASIRTAQKQLDVSKLNLETIVEQSRFETSSDYYDLQNSDAQVKIQEAAVEDANQTLKDAQLRERAGLGTRFDVLRAEVELAQAQQSLTTAIANQNISRRQLAETISVSHDTDLSTADAIEEAGVWDLQLAETIVQAFKNRAELEQFLLQREIAEEQQTVALSQTRPTVSASANYSSNDDFDDNFDPTDNYSVGLNLQWRLFDGGAARAAADQTEVDGKIAETNFADQRNQIRFGVEQAFFQLKSNQNNIQTATKEVELAEESLRLARLRFTAGVGTQTDVIEAQTQLTTARGNLLESIIEYNQSYVALQRQVSNTPDNSLQDLP